MENFNFIGKNLTDRDKKSTSNYLDKLHFESTEINPDNYREPTQEELFDIQKAKELIENELKLLGIDFTTLNLNNYQFKFLKESEGKGVYDSETRVIEIEGKYKVKLENILNNPINIIPTVSYFTQKLLTKIIQNNKNSKTESNYSTIVHESIHSKSFHKYELNIDKKNNSESSIYNVDAYRNGYLLTKNGQEDYFRGLNEGIIDKITMDILIKEYKDEPNISNKIRKILYYIQSGYFIEMLTVDVLVNRISKSKNESKNEIWSRFKKGQFTGNMMHLRDIEEAYEPGALRILATMNPRTNMKNIKNLLYYTYFSTQSHIIRSIIEKKLLSNESRNKLKKHT